MFEAVQFIEAHGLADPEETVLATFEREVDAIEGARQGRREFVAIGSTQYAWWIVRKAGADLANFIADSKSEKEFVLDLTSGQLVEV